jgi:nucleotide-binding universal stress UspA family protein
MTFGRQGHCWMKKNGGYMFKHILVPTDFSEQSRQALGVALRIAAQAGSRLTLLHVIEVIADASFEEFDSFYTKLEKRALRIIHEWTKEAEKDHPSIEQQILYGNRAGQIVKFASNNQVDLIVMSSHRIEKDNPGRGWGTISYQVGVLAECAVMLLK